MIRCHVKNLKQAGYVTGVSDNVPGRIRLSLCTTLVITEQAKDGDND